VLAPELSDPTRLEALQAAWRERGRLRIEGFLGPSEAEALHTELREQPFELRVPGQGEFLSMQYWEFPLTPARQAEAPRSVAFLRWFCAEGRAWLSELTGRPLAPPLDDKVIATLYAKGCYLDTHNDAREGRSLAFVLGLTRGRWPAEEGGHLEYLRFEEGRLEVEERCAPGWNTLDIFPADPAPLHRIPLVREQHERRAITGWFEAAS